MVQWSGSLIGAKAGAHCHRSNPRDGDYDFEDLVWITDGITPRYEYTWGACDFFLSEFLLAYCYAQC